MDHNGPADTRPSTVRHSGILLTSQIIISIVYLYSTHFTRNVIDGIQFVITNLEPETESYKLDDDIFFGFFIECCSFIYNDDIRTHLHVSLTYYTTQSFQLIA